MNDFRYALRQLLKNPGFTALAVLVLGLGIGANTAIFTLVNAFVLRPLPFHEPDRLAGVYAESTLNPGSFRAFSYPNYRDLREQNDVFSSVLAHNLAMVGWTEGETTRRLFADVTSANYFETLGVPLAKGRAFRPEEEEPGAAQPVAILSHRLWQQMGGSEEIVGRTLRINGRVFTVVGVAPRYFTGTMALFSPDLWLPLGVYELLKNDFDNQSSKRLGDRDNDPLILGARLKPGVTTAAATAQLRVLAERMGRAFPAENRDWTLRAEPMPRLGINTAPDGDGGDELGGVAVVLMAVAAVVLLIACLNLANMLLARGAVRRKEIAIRLALGASRRQILRQLLVEGVVLALAGGMAGLCLSFWITELILGSMQPLLPLAIVFDPSPDFRVLAATLGFCMVSTLFFAAGPAWKLSRPDVVPDLKEQTDGVTGLGRLLTARNLLVIGQISLSLTLLAAAGLFVRGAWKAAEFNPGFQVQDGVLLEFDSRMAGYDETQGRLTAAALVGRVGLVPGVESVSLGATVPFGMLQLFRNVQRAGIPPLPPETRAETPAQGKTFITVYNAVGPDYFKTLGVTLLQGREFTESEALRGGGPRVAIIDDALARRLWPGEEAIGRRLRFSDLPIGNDRVDDGPRMGASSGTLRVGEEAAEFEVVGVVPRVLNGLFEVIPSPHVYVPFGQSFHSAAFLHVRLRPGDDAAQSGLMESIRRQVREADPRLPVLSFRTFRAHLQASGEHWIVVTGAWLFTLFGGLALFLAVIGVYGVKAYAVSQRTREIGIRMALGARRTDVVGMIVREGLRLTGAAMLIGLPLAAGLGQLLRGALYQVGALDPVVFTLTPMLLTLAALVAAYLPARRAARIEPMRALRYE